MQVYYWTGFGKRNNSTKQPDLQDATEANVVLKDGCSIENPVLETAQIPLNASYFHISDFGRYYFVTERVKVSNTVTRFHLATDPLATFKTAIGNYTGHIARCSDATFYNPYISDAYNIPTSDVDFASEVTPCKDFQQIQSIFHAGGIYVLGVMGKPTNANVDNYNGMSRYYYLTAMQMQQLAALLNDNTFLQNVKNEFTNPMDCITECHWLPIQPSILTETEMEPLYLGAQQVTGTNVLIVKNRFLRTVNSVTMPAGIGDFTYTNRGAYAAATISFPFVGQVPLDMEMLHAGLGTSIETVIDVFTGDIMHTMYSTTGRYRWKTYTGNCKTSIPIMSNTRDFTGAISNFIGAVGGVMTGNVAGAVAGVMDTTASLLSHDYQVNGSYSSGLAVYGDLDFTVRYYKRKPSHAIEDLKNIDGLVCDKVAMISSHPGYLVMSNASIDIDGTEQDRTAVNGYLNSGFFYE